VLFVCVKTSTYKYDALFFSKLRLALFSVCNFQYFPVFTTVALLQISTTVRGTLSGGADSDTVDSD